MRISLEIFRVAKKKSAGRKKTGGRKKSGRKTAPKSSSS